jgi:hypothetical protein
MRQPGSNDTTHFYTSPRPLRQAWQITVAYICADPVLARACASENKLEIAVTRKS